MRKHQATHQLICTAIMKHVPICLSLLPSRVCGCVWVVVCVCVCVCVCVNVCTCVCMCVSSCFAHTLKQSLNEFPECVRERQHCRSISGESPADYMDLGINERGRFVQSEPTSGSFQQRLLDKQTDRREGSRRHLALKCWCRLTMPSGNKNATNFA